MSKLVKLFPPDMTFHNGRRADPAKGLDIPAHEVEYLVARGWHEGAKPAPAPVEESDFELEISAPRALSEED